ncbi:MAG: hypothetical protein NTX79_00235 [Candidatus Micrarchaeota archaeon]|nr:hypothetical protein [Candidatus Micrarchaeota archaeon]
MVSLKKYAPCRCGANNSFDFNSDLAVEDLTLTARCPSCGASVTISISSLFSPLQPASPSPATPDAALAQAHAEEETKANVEQAVRDLFR